MKIYASLADDISEGFVWLERTEFPSRCIVKIANRENGRSAYCEALQIDDNYLRNYNQAPRITIDTPKSSVVINSWYRARLGDIGTSREYDLEIATANWWWGKLRACMQHPQIVVRVAAWLGLIGVVLGILGVVLGAISLRSSGIAMWLRQSSFVTNRRIVGYGVSVFVAMPVTYLWSRALHASVTHLRRPAERDAERVPWIPFVVGVVERVLVTTLVGWNVSGAAGFIGAWIAVKSAGGWQSWSKGTTYGRAILFIGLLGSALSILFAIAGGLIIFAAQQGAAAGGRR